MNVLFMPCKLKENGEILAGLRVDCPVVKFLFFLKKNKNLIFVVMAGFGQVCDGPCCYIFESD